MNESRLVSVIVCALMLACWLFGYKAGRGAYSVPLPSVETRVDTVVVRDTITRERPVYTRAYVRDTIRVRVCDTILVALPHEVRVYEDSLYRAEVSGYLPSLDRIEIYPRTVTVTRTDKVTQVVTVKNPTRWGLGVQVGYGVGLHSGKVYTAPYVGVGLSWNILTF